MKTKFVAGFFILVLFSAVSEGSVHLFNFGPEGSETPEGWTLVTENDAYSAEKGFGWKPGPELFSRNENWVTGTYFMELDYLLATHVTGGSNGRYPDAYYTFRVDTGSGEFLVGLITGKMTERHGSRINKPPFWYSDYNISLNGEEVYSRQYSLDEYLSWWYSGFEDEFLPGDSIYDRYVKRYFPSHVHRVEAGGTLEIAVSAVCPVNAVVIYPASMSREFHDKLDEIRRKGCEFLDGQYSEEGAEKEALSESLEAEYACAGYIPFARPHAEITPYSRPSADEAGRPAATFITRGDLARVSFSLLPLRDLEQARISVGNLIGPGGEIIPGETAEVWLERYYSSPVRWRASANYRIRPWYSLKFENAEDFRAGLPRTFDLYFRIPAGAAAGVYEGEAELSFANAPSYSQDVKIKVLPFELDEPDVLFGMYSFHPEPTSLRFADRSNPGFREISRHLTRINFKEMAEMGFNTVSISMPWWPFRIEDDGEIVGAAEPRVGDSGSRVSTWELWEDAFELYVEHFGNNPFSVFGIGWTSLVHSRLVPGFWTGTADINNWENEGYSEEAVKKARVLVEHFYRKAEELGLPEVLFYISDELSNQGERGGRFGEALASVYRGMADDIGFRTMASMNGPGERRMFPYLDISAIHAGAINSPNPLTAAVLEEIQEAGSELWFYNAGNNRFAFGYYMVRTGAKGRLQWAYGQHSTFVSQVPFLPSVGSLEHAFIIDSNLRHGRRTNIEGLRQGIVDYRYFRTLERLLDENDIGEKARAGGERVLARIYDGVRIEGIREPWSDDVCERLRWMMALAIMEILNEDS